MPKTYSLSQISKGLSGCPRSILLLYTGGTIGMAKNENTGSLAPYDFSRIFERLPQLAELDYALTLLSFEELIDSSDVSPQDWLEMAGIIRENYDRYHGFVILHGTDTMAYSSSAMSYLLQDLRKPVIFTGSQLPITNIRTDARENFITALQIAAEHKKGEPVIQEVCIYFNNLLLRGNRAQKLQSNDFTAFASENHPPLAKAGTKIVYNQPAFLDCKHSERPKSFERLEPNVGILKIFPGMTQAFVRSILLNPDLKGIVMETFGAGNAPTASWLKYVLAESMALGKIILNVSQCNGGAVEQGLYAAGKHLEDIGVLGCADMTTEAALTKLMFVLANYESREEQYKALSISIAGEMSAE